MKNYENKKVDNKRLLIITQYFPPEVGAPQNRLYELAVRLQNQGLDIEVLTAMPNYPKMEIFEQYKGKKWMREDVGGIKTVRSSIYVSKSKGVVKRLLNYFSFVFSSLWIGCFKIGRKDLILVESPPLFLGISAYILAKIKKSKMIFNVSDLWPESAEKLGVVTNRPLLKLATWLEEFLYKKASMISGQTQGICKNISTRMDKPVYWLKNGVDLNLYDPNKSIDSSFREEYGYNKKDFILFYGGIIGLAQGLDVILYAANKLRTYPDIKFLLLGSGPDLERLKNLANKLELTNVLFHQSVPKSEMYEIIRGTDAAIIPLKKLDLFKGAIPSKIFENLAMKKPILLGVEGEAKELFIDQGKCGLAFEPENDEDLSRQILSLYNNRSKVSELGENGYVYVSNNFNRNLIAKEFYNELIKI